MKNEKQFDTEVAKIFARRKFPDPRVVERVVDGPAISYRAITGPGQTVFSSAISDNRLFDETIDAMGYSPIKGKNVFVVSNYIAEFGEQFFTLPAVRDAYGEISVTNSFADHIVSAFEQTERPLQRIGFPASPFDLANGPKEVRIRIGAHSPILFLDVKRAFEGSPKGSSVIVGRGRLKTPSLASDLPANRLDVRIFARADATDEGPVEEFETFFSGCKNARKVSSLHGEIRKEPEVAVVFRRFGAICETALPTIEFVSFELDRKLGLLRRIAIGSLSATAFHSMTNLFADWGAPEFAQ